MPLVAPNGTEKYTGSHLLTVHMHKCANFTNIHSKFMINSNHMYAKNIFWVALYMRVAIKGVYCV